MESDLVKLSEIDLIELLCSQDDNVAAYSEFTNRFLPNVLIECKNICKKRKLDPHIGIQIAHETFERVKKYKSFKSDKIRITDRGKAIHVYLLKIASRLFLDYHRKQKSKEIIHKSYFDDILESTESELDLERLKYKKELSIFIFNKLNKKEQSVVLRDLEYKKHQKYLPDDVTETLANELCVKKNTITKIRERAIIKIKKAIHEINQEN